MSILQRISGTLKFTNEPFVYLNFQEEDREPQAPSTTRVQESIAGNLHQKLRTEPVHLHTVIDLIDFFCLGRLSPEVESGSTVQRLFAAKPHGQVCIMVCINL